MAANETVRNALTLPVCLIIMDGLGLAEPGPGNAVSLANYPYARPLVRNVLMDEACSFGRGGGPCRPGKWATPKWGT